MTLPLTMVSENAVATSSASPPLCRRRGTYRTRASERIQRTTGEMSDETLLLPCIVHGKARSSSESSVKFYPTPVPPGGKLTAIIKRAQRAGRARKNKKAPLRPPRAPWAAQGQNPKSQMREMRIHMFMYVEQYVSYRESIGARTLALYSGTDSQKSDPSTAYTAPGSPTSARQRHNLTWGLEASKLM